MSQTPDENTSMFYYVIGVSVIITAIGLAILIIILALNRPKVIPKKIVYKPPPSPLRLALPAGTRFGPDHNPKHPPIQSNPSLATPAPPALQTSFKPSSFPIPPTNPIPLPANVK
jgi:hypothetical protein